MDDRERHEAAHATVAMALGYSPETQFFPTDSDGNAGATYWRTEKTTPTEVVMVSLAPLLFEFMTGDTDYSGSLGDFEIVTEELEPFSPARRAEILEEAIHQAIEILLANADQVEQRGISLLGNDSCVLNLDDDEQREPQ